MDFCPFLAEVLPCLHPPAWETLSSFSVLDRVGLTPSPLARGWPASQCPRAWRRERLCWDLWGCRLEWSWTPELRVSLWGSRLKNPPWMAAVYKVEGRPDRDDGTNKTLLLGCKFKFGASETENGWIQTDIMRHISFLWSFIFNFSKSFNSYFKLETYLLYLQSALWRAFG